MLGIIFGVLAAVGQGLGYALLKKSFDERASSIAYFADMVFGLLIWIPAGFLLGIEWHRFFYVFGYALLSAALAEAFVFFVLAKGEISLTQPVFSTYPLFTLLFSLRINGDIVTLPVLLAIITIIIGIVVLSTPAQFNRAELKKRALLLWPLAGAIAVGVSDSLSKHAIDSVSAGTFLVALAIAQIPVAFGYLLVEKQPFSEVVAMYKNVKEYRFSFLGSLSIVSSLIFFWLAFANTLASIASPITATYVLFAIFFAIFFVKEKVIVKDYIGMGLTVAGVLALSFLVVV